MAKELVEMARDLNEAGLSSDVALETIELRHFGPDATAQDVDDLNGLPSPHSGRGLPRGAPEASLARKGEGATPAETHRRRPLTLHPYLAALAKGWSPLPERGGGTDGVRG
jgi:hypothetical protein